MNKIIEAARFANDAHSGQRRKYTGDPYIVHPMRVAGAAMLFPFTDEDLACAAWLHDVVEDCNVDALTIGSLFGETVQGYVSALTNPSKGSKATRRDRKRMDREHIAGAPWRVQAIKLLDRIDNVMDMHGAPDDFKQLYAVESELLADAMSPECSELKYMLRREIMRMVQA